MKLMHKLTVKEPRLCVFLWDLCRSSITFFLLSTAADAAAVARYLLKTLRLELSWSSLNEHLINHPYNALSLSASLCHLSLSLSLEHKLFFYHKKTSSSLFCSVFFSWSVDCWWQLKYLKKSTFLLLFVVPVQFFRCSFLILLALVLFRDEWYAIMVN